MSKSKPNEIYLERIYDAPVKLVWDAWTDPKKAAKWWGPRGFTLTTHSKDFKVGGTWNYTMHGPDGVDYPNITTYHEVVPNSRLVYDHGASEGKPPLFKVTVNFIEMKNNKTKMEMWMALETPEAAEQIKKFIKQAGGNATWDRLAEYLEETGSGKDVFVINRSFKASLDTMFEVWTTPEHIAKWLSPTGFSMKFMEANIKPGGSTFYMMTNGDVTMYGKAHYKEISKNRLVYTQQFADKDGNMGRHPMAPTWPAFMQTTVDFEAEGPNETRVTITWEVFGEATAEERAMFHTAKGGMTMGWTGSFDKLEEYLSR